MRAQFVTRTLTVVVSELPAESLTRSFSVWEPSPAHRAVSHTQLALVAVVVLDQILTPSCNNVKVRVLAVEPDTAMRTVTEPVSVFRGLGLVRTATRPAARLETVTDRVAVAVMLAESVTVVVSVCAPLLTFVVFQPTVLLRPAYTLAPSTASLYV